MGHAVSSHDVLKANPVWSAYEADGEALKAKRAALAQHALDVKQPHEQAVRDHRAAVAAAVDAGEVPPMAPEPPDLRHLADAAALLQMQEEAHRGRKSAVLAEVSEDVLQGLRDRESARQARLAMLAPEVHRLRTETVADLALFAQVLGAVDREAGLSVHPSRQERVSREVSTDGLLNAAEAGVSLLQPAPIGEVTGRVMRDDGSDDGVRQQGRRPLGMSSGTFGNVDRWPREQRLPPGRV